MKLEEEVENLWSNSSAITRAETEKKTKIIEELQKKIKVL